MACVHCWGCGDGTEERWLWLRLTSPQSPWCWQSTDLRQTGGEHISPIRVLTDCMTWTNVKRNPSRQKKDIHMCKEREKQTYEGNRIWSSGHDLCNHQHEDSQREQNRDAWRQTQDTREQWVQRQVGVKKKVEEHTHWNGIFWYVVLDSSPQSSFSLHSQENLFDFCLSLIFPPAFLSLSFLCLLLPPSQLSWHLTKLHIADWKFFSNVDRETPEEWNKPMLSQELRICSEQYILSYSRYTLPFSIFLHSASLIVTPSLTPVLLQPPLVIPHPGWFSPLSSQGAGRPAGSSRRGARRGWGGLERKTESSFAKSPRR